MKSDFYKIWKILSLKEKNQLIKSSLLKFFSGVMDVVGVASIMPFIAVVSNQKILNENKIIISIKDYFSFENYEMIIFLAISSLFLIILNQTTRVLGGWYETYVTHNIWWSLHRQMFTYYINQPYSYHIQTNSNQLLEKIEVQMNAAVVGVIKPIFQILGNLFTFLLLLIFLIIADPLATTILIGIIGIFYFLIYSKLKEKIINYGSFGPKYSAKTFKLVDQAFRSIKDIKLKDNEKFYINLFEPLAKTYANNQVKINLISTVPRFGLEIFAYIFAFSIIIYFIIFGSKNFTEVIILVGIYAFALQKILPAVQGIYQQITLIKFYKPSLDKIYNDLHSATTQFRKNKFFNPKNNNFNFSKKIEFKNISFQYPSSKESVLNIENLEIKAGSFIGITGKTGSGKTTFIDLFLALLKPTSGQILVDGLNLKQDLTRVWHAKIGYVPQASFMADDTITNNIALGKNENEIDPFKIKNASRIAGLENFIENDLPQKYNTIIGESGIRLSGGQKQRISIARAFYDNHDIIVLDEATNSLDNITEKSFIDSLQKIKSNKTIIMVTHKLLSLKKCDEILFLDEGIISDKGTYEDLIQNNSKFKDLSNVYLN